MTVSARAVAYEGNGPNCIYVLNPSAPARVLGQRQCRREQRLRPAGGLELLDRFVGSRQRLDHGAEYRRGGGIQFGRQLHPFADAEDWGDSGVRSAGQRAGADGRFMRSYQFFAEREQRQQRQSLPALCWHLLRRYLGPRQCRAVFQRGNLRARRRRNEHKRQHDDDRHRDNLLQHDGHRRLRGNFVQRQHAGEFQCADLGSAGRNPVLSGSLDSEQRRGAAPSVEIRVRLSMARSTSRRPASASTATAAPTATASWWRIS